MSRITRHRTALARAALPNCAVSRSRRPRCAGPRPVLPVRVRVSGAEHPDTLAVRNDLAYWTGQAENKPGDDVN